ncbi:MAG: hypothetical protein J6Y20_09940 [Lachnospiraceae bacterium]|nr:hypothetical protein [Lachnospiraceae bacterium]
MKTWMKVLMWFGLGGGIGFFAGYQVGAKVQKKEDEADIPQESEPEKVVEAIHTYLGREDGDVDGDHFLVNPFRTATDEDDEMPEEEPRIGDEEEIEDIPQLHPQDLVPNIISEEAYYQNEWDFEQNSLVYYAGDNVLFNVDTQSVVNHPNEVIGLGMLMGLDADHETLFIKNDTISVLFRIDWSDGSYDDRRAGDILPDEENDDFTEEDLD